VLDHQVSQLGSVDQYDAFCDAPDEVSFASAELAPCLRRAS
jgi:hypothetical protein